MFFDIGSNIGNWSLSNINLCDKIIAVEASPITFNELADRCKHDNIVLLNYAVCDNNGEDITFYHAYTHTLSTINKDWLTNETSRFYNYPFTQITCKTITIDKLIQIYGMPELIKIDVEGGEYQCITSLTQKAKMICFEWASETNHITYKCIQHLSHLGYTQFYLQNEDQYLFRPLHTDFYDIHTILQNLHNTTPKIDWGMVWAN
jgi:hypothetical protein